MLLEQNAARANYDTTNVVRINVVRTNVVVPFQSNTLKTLTDQISL